MSTLAGVPIEQTRYCRDCFYVRNKQAVEEEWRCKSPSNVTVSPVSFMPIISIITGDPIPQFSTCHSARNHNATGCGREGAWFLTTAQYLNATKPKPRDPLVAVSRGAATKLGIGDI